MKKPNSIAKSISGILLIAVLLAAACPISAHAADDNPDSSTLDAFPALGVSSDTMNTNYGTINTLYSDGTVKDNVGYISSSQGSVYENHGSIDSLSSGQVGTNYRTINLIENTGKLVVNDKNGEVLKLHIGGVVDRNYGIIGESVGNVSENYGTITDNYGSVIMHDGQVVNNYKGGTVTFETKISGSETIVAKGTIDNNEGKVIIRSGTVTIKENTGNIEINNATVTVEKNSGNITVGNNATLICGENGSDGEITKSSESAVVTCTVNNGRIYDETAVRYKIVFVGDDGKAVITECDLEKDGVYYTQAGSGVIFTLPPEYECSSAKKLESGSVNTWGLNAKPAEGDTEFTIICRKCTPCDLSGHNFISYISNGDATCTADGTKTATCANGCGATDTIADTGSAKGHTFDEWKTTKEATETETGTRERICSVCNAKETEEIPVLTPASYSIIFGANSKWTKGNTDGLVFSSDAPFDKFDSVKIDGTTIETTNYTAESGSTKITISPAYLETLGIGKHSIEIVSTNGTASAKFAVISSKSTDPTKPTDPSKPTNPTSPRTGDNSHMFLWIALMFVSIGALAGTVVVGKKRRCVSGDGSH